MTLLKPRDGRRIVQRNTNFELEETHLEDIREGTGFTNINLVIKELFNPKPVFNDLHSFYRWIGRLETLSG